MEVRRTVRPWSVRVIVLLLLLEGIGLCGLGLFRGPWLNWIRLLGADGSPQPGMTALIIIGIFTLAGLGALVAALGMLLRVRVSWLIAMLVQTVILLACLQLYFTVKPDFIYPVMVCSIATVLYLNSAEVRMAFHADSLAPRVETLDES